MQIVLMIYKMFLSKSSIQGRSTIGLGRHYLYNGLCDKISVFKWLTMNQNALLPIRSPTMLSTLLSNANNSNNSAKFVSHIYYLQHISTIIRLRIPQSHRPMINGSTTTCTVIGTATVVSILGKM